MRDEILDNSSSLADLVASRLCHDLVNPLGAIGNGVELLEMTGKADGPEVELIRDAVRAAEARIRLFRLGFGAALPGQTTSAREARTAVEGYFHQSRVSIDWGVTTDNERQQIKLAILMLLCVENALPMGGDVRMQQTAPGQWQIEASGPRLNVDEALWSTLRFGPATDGRPTRPAEAHFAVLVQLADALGVAVNYIADGDTLRMSTA